MDYDKQSGNKSGFTKERKQDCEDDILFERFSLSEYKCE